MAQLKDHIVDHFFQGVCVCPCVKCTVSASGGTLVVCICNLCPPSKCGAKPKEKAA